MKTRTYLLMGSALLFLLAVLYRNLPYEKNGSSFDQYHHKFKSKNLKAQSKVSSDLKTEEESVPSQKEVMIEQSSQSPLAKSFLAKMRRMKEAHCYKDNTFWDTYPDFVDPRDVMYKDQLKLKNKAEEVLSLYASGLIGFHKEMAPEIQRLQDNFDENHVALYLLADRDGANCEREADLGSFIGSLTETITNPKVKKWFIQRSLLLGKIYLRSNTTSGQKYAAAVLMYLEHKGYIPEYQSQELNQISDELDRHINDYPFELKKLKGEELEAAFNAHLDKKKEINKRIIDIIDEISLKEL